jgi:NAD(P)-dependent dehydrogenase (short-subunit alcohol dehydrogenase family)
MDISGKVAVVTGAGQGLGLAYATALADAGAAVVVNDVNAESAEGAVGAITAAGGLAVAEVVPVGSTEAAERLVGRALQAFGRLDVMVTNAGVLRDRVLWNMSDEDFDTVVQVHLRGTFTCVREAAKQFRAQGEGGRVILAGSPAGQRGNFGQTNYAAAKAGIVAMARTWAMELAKAGVTVNAVIPNAATAMTETIPFLAPYVERMAQGLPVPSVVRRAASFGTPEDVAGLVVYLASDAAAAVTGQAIGIGGDRLSLWSHPTEIRSAFLDGGWTADAIAEAFASSVGESLESYGIAAPMLPALTVPHGLQPQEA